MVFAGVVAAVVVVDGALLFPHLGDASPLRSLARLRRTGVAGRFNLWICSVRLCCACKPCVVCFAFQVLFEAHHRVGHQAPRGASALSSAI